MTRPPRRPSALLLAALTATIAACGGGGGSGAAVQSVTVTGREMKFEPADLTLAPGRYRFHFVNAGATYHDLGIYRDGKGLSVRSTGPGQSIDLDVIKLVAGAYTMECREPGHLQAGMRGTVTVRSQS